MNEIILNKKFPDDYSDDVKKVISTLSFTNGENIKVVGSMNVRNQLYSADFDCFEIVKNNVDDFDMYLKQLKKGFQNIIVSLLNIYLCYIGDIKCGIVAEWQVLPDNFDNYNYSNSLKVLDNVLREGIIDTTEYNQKKKLLKKDLSINDFILIKEEYKYHIVRWSINDVLRGFTLLLNDKKYTLEDGFKSPSITKIDVISWIMGNRFADFSCIYQFEYNNIPINDLQIDLDISLKYDIINYLNKEKYFKMAKRLFSLNLLYGNRSQLDKLSILFNSSLGKLYQISSDIKTIQFLIENQENVPLDRLHFEQNHFKSRLANVNIPSYLNKKDIVLDIIDRLSNLPIGDDNLMYDELQKLDDILENILSKETKVFLENNKMIPLKSTFLQ